MFTFQVLRACSSHLDIVQRRRRGHSPRDDHEFVPFRARWPPLHILNGSLLRGCNGAVEISVGMHEVEARRPIVRLSSRVHIGARQTEYCPAIRAPPERTFLIKEAWAQQSSTIRRPLEGRSVISTISVRNELRNMMGAPRSRGTSRMETVLN